MEESRFQLEFGWKEFIVFIFFSLVSFSAIFFLGFIQGKNQPIGTRIETNPLKEQQLQVKEFIDDSESLLSKQKSLSQKEDKVAEKKEDKVAEKKEDKKVSSKTDKENIQQNANLLSENKYVVQLIAYGNKTLAEKLQKKLKDAFFPAYISTTQLNGKTYYRVRVGSYNLNEAKKVKQTIQQKYPALEKTQIFKID